MPTGSATRGGPGRRPWRGIGPAPSPAGPRNRGVRGGPAARRGATARRGAAPRRWAGAPGEPPPPAESSCRRCLEGRATITPRSAWARAAQCGARPSGVVRTPSSRGSGHIGQGRTSATARVVEQGDPRRRRSAPRECARCNANVTRPHGRCHSLSTAPLPRAGSAHHGLSRRGARAAQNPRPTGVAGPRRLLTDDG